MSQRTLLVVDDQPSVCVSLAYLLQFAGYKVLTAESGSAAITVAEKEAIDGTLIDIHMPVMDGFETCRRLQAQSQLQGRPLRAWFITGALVNGFEARSAEVGGLGVIPKPFEHPSFLALLEHGFSSPSPPFPPVTWAGSYLADFSARP